MVSRARPDGRLPGRHDRPRGRAGRPARDDRALRADGRPRRDPRSAAGPERRSRSASGASTRRGYDSKYATLYWPWIKVFDPLSGQNEFVPPSGHMAGIWGRNDDTRGVHKAPANEVVRGAIVARDDDHEGGARPAEPDGHQLHPRVPGPRHPRLGRPHALERSVLALPQRPPALQLHRGVDPRRHPVGRLRAERPRSVAAHPAHDQRVPAAASGATARCSARRRSEAFYVKCDAETNPPEVVDRRPGHRARSASRRSSRPSSSSSALAQFSGGADLAE